jgi:hypothetical protein
VSALTGDILAPDPGGTWRIVLTAGGIPVTDKRRGYTADYVIYDEAHTFTTSTATLTADEHTRWSWGPAT